MTASPPDSHRQGLLPAALWWPAIRPKTLSLAAIPVLAGSALAWSDGAARDWSVFIATLACALLIQAGTNLFNDARDAQSGNDGPDRLGPARVTGGGLASPVQVERSAWVLFALALSAGVYLVVLGGWPILAIGLAALTAGWAYSGGPRPLSHTAWGELFVVAFFGLAAVGGSYYLQGRDLTLPACLAGLALGLHAAAVLLMNNIRDRKADARAGRRTLAQVLGPDGALGLYAALLLAPFPLLAAALGPAGLGLAWGALPFCAWLAWRSRVLAPGAAMNRQMVLTVMAQVLLGVFLALTLWMDAAQVPVPPMPAFSAAP